MSTLAASDLELGYGAEPVLTGVGLEIVPGELVGLVGPNGAGKTTLLRALAGLARPRRGSVRLDGEPLAALPRQRVARAIGYLEQGARCHWPMRVRDVVALGRLAHRAGWGGRSPSDAEAIDHALAMTDTAALAGRRVDELSGGERARVMLARALAATPAILLADEPTAGLDPEHQLGILRRLRDLARSGTCAVAVLHDLTHATRFCDRVIVVHGGGLAADGAASEVLTAELLERCFRIRAHLTEVAGERIVVPFETVSDTSDE